MVHQANLPTLRLSLNDFHFHVVPCVNLNIFFYCFFTTLSCLRSHLLVFSTNQPTNQPTTLQLGDASQGPEGVQQVRTLKSLPAQFDATGLVETQFQATSEDGTQVKLFVAVIMFSVIIMLLLCRYCNAVF